MGKEDRCDTPGCVLEDVEEEGGCWGGVCVTDADSWGSFNIGCFKFKEVELMGGQFYLGELRGRREALLLSCRTLEGSPVCEMMIC